MKLLLLALLLLLSADASASTELFAGYLRASLPKTGSSYEAFPVALSFGVGERELRLARASLRAEPFFSAVSAPEGALEAGSNLLVKITLPARGRLTPYLNAGAGLVYISGDIREQSSGMNFTTQAGAGVEFKTPGRLNLMLECRFRHVSNGGRKKPNSGIDSMVFLAGVSRRL